MKGSMREASRTAAAEEASQSEVASVNGATCRLLLVLMHVASPKGARTMQLRNKAVRTLLLDTVRLL